jgi:hypothetical protein
VPPFPQIRVRRASRQGAARHVTERNSLNSVAPEALSWRIDDLRDTLGGRIAHIEAQNDMILGVVSDLGQRVTRLEAKGR